MAKVALITGAAGQDGSYLAEFLLRKNYTVHGLVRWSSIPKLDNLANVLKDPHFVLHYGDVTDAATVFHLVKKIKPDEIYHLAAQSHVHVSFDQPLHTLTVDAGGALNLLEAVRLSDLKSVRFYNAATSELMGKVQEIPQTEKTPFYPRSPYACAKLAAYWLTRNYREAYGIFASNGILFNHESPRRGFHFVTRKITLALAQILAGKQDKLYLGNLDAQRDWGSAHDYITAMYLILQADKPDDFVIATGKTTSVREFATLAFKEAGINLRWENKGVDEKGIDEKGRVLIEVDPTLFRPTEVDLLIGNATKAKSTLGWEPKVTLQTLIKEMVEADLQRAGVKIEKSTVE